MFLNSEILKTLMEMLSCWVVSAQMTWLGHLFGHILIFTVTSGLLTTCNSARFQVKGHNPSQYCLYFRHQPEVWVLAVTSLFPALYKFQGSHYPLRFIMHETVLMELTESTILTVTVLLPPNGNQNQSKEETNKICEDSRCGFCCFLLWNQNTLPWHVSVCCQY